jgi:molecular chaperone GrpE
MEREVDMHEVPIDVRPPAKSRAAAPAQDVAQDAAPAVEVSPEAGELNGGPGQELEIWRDRALRLQAGMDNYRKRQRRLAEEQIAAGRERVLRSLLDVADNLSRALRARDADRASLREGIEITLQSVNQALDREGVQPIEAKGAQFDPAWHEAVGTVPHRDVALPPNTVFEVSEKGYRMDDRILRPARVIVAI